MSGCRLCGFGDPLACIVLRRHDWIEWLLLLVVLDELQRVKAEA